MVFRHDIAVASLAGLCVLGAGFAIANPSGFPGVRQTGGTGTGAVVIKDLQADDTIPDTIRRAPVAGAAEASISARAADQDLVVLAASSAPGATDAALPAVLSAAVPAAAGDATANPQAQPVAASPVENASPLDASGTGAGQAAAADQAGQTFGFDIVMNKARALAAMPYEKSSQRLPASVANLGYDDYRRIRPRPRTADWIDGSSSFQVQYSPQGFLFKDRVRINMVENGISVEKRFDPSKFNFYDLPLSDEDKAAMGFAGLRLTTPLNSAGKYDEFLSFQGASYFRALGAENRYGISARGLALSTASPTGEEFPVFTEFWLVRPEPGSNEVTVYALLDSESIAGAYRFRARPGATTEIQVDAFLYPRRDLNHVGIAPLTSMYEFGPQDPLKGRDDFRPRVHDSEGLMIRLRNGEWVWRPLVNPNQLEISSFTSEMPYGYGLMQRNRDFDNYQDLEARYDLRPSLWIEPRNDWGPGHLALVEIPSANEFNDNIVSYWRPDAPLKGGGEYEYSYTMHWGDNAPIKPSFAQVEATRVGVPINNSVNRLFVIDFVSGNNALLDGAQIHVSSSAGTVEGVTLQENPVTGGRRLTFELNSGGANVAELRALLMRGGSPVSETWLYRWRR
ncbi:glucan biosynthesis protein [Aquisalinus flavus]|uniref:Glucans biosynthesis protein G n=1 Tax=Aquisalinus flavus TaxID=1526572 RepID=A0A8J2Y5X4_9PROT|nr:glucan biosynthesis protein G [Aquisalinus flavus]MBD0425235.1 glucan biosynthesis protein G [Aquisalinus flavus]UNE49105.1 glucan biosynthesis protein G [Aquisalinus flavus]GGD17661.1 glucans biosynthesis protein G [Aquisalinus flavus]